MAFNIVPPCHQLGALPGRLAVGRYGGGGDLQLEEGLITVDTRVTDAVCSKSQRCELIAACCKIYDDWRFQCEDSRVWQFRPDEPPPVLAESWSWSSSIVLSCPTGLLESVVGGGHTRNAFFHSWIFEDALCTDIPQADAWPLVSVVEWGSASTHSISGRDCNTDVLNIERWCGSGWCGPRPADQHYHQSSSPDELIASMSDVDEAERAEWAAVLAAAGQSEPSIGSDMAIFEIPPFDSDSVASVHSRVRLGDIVAVNIDSRKVHIASLILAPYEDKTVWLEDIAAATIPATNGDIFQLDVVQLQDRLRARHSNHAAVAFLQRFH